jgi:hypothetical protein
MTCLCVFLDAAPTGELCTVVLPCPILLLLSPSPPLTIIHICIFFINKVYSTCFKLILFLYYLPLMGTLSVNLFPRQEQVHCHPALPTAVLNSTARPSTPLPLLSTSRTTTTMICPLMPPPPLPLPCPPLPWATNRKLICGVCHHPSMVCQIGRSGGWVPCLMPLMAPRPPAQPPRRAAHAACSVTAIALMCTWAQQPLPPCTRPGSSGGRASQGRHVTPP